MKEKSVSFKVRQQQVVGMLHLPDDLAEPVPAVVFFHGFRGNKQEPHRLFVKMARALSAVGIAALRFDFRGSGDSAGDFSKMTITGEQRDARQALRFLRKRKEIDASRVGILGLSMGGLVAAYMLGEDQDLKTGALWSAVGDAKASAQRKMSPEVVSQFDDMGFADMGGWAVGQPLFEELMTLEPTQAITATSASVLVIHGTEDDVLPVEDAIRYEKGLEEAGCDVQLCLVEGAGHTYDSLQWETELIAMTLDWFLRKL